MIVGCPYLELWTLLRTYYAGETLSSRAGLTTIPELPDGVVLLKDEGTMTVPEIVEVLRRVGCPIYLVPITAATARSSYYVPGWFLEIFTLVWPEYVERLTIEVEELAFLQAAVRLIPRLWEDPQEGAQIVLSIVRLSGVEEGVRTLFEKMRQTPVLGERGSSMGA